MGPLQHARLLGVEIEVIAPLVEVGDAGEKLAVEVERALVLRQLRRDVALDGLQRVGWCRRSTG